jgi:mRNA interferase MazF
MAHAVISVLRGEVFWADFGQPRGSEQAGRRMVLVVQNDAGNRSSPTTIVAAVTTRRPSRQYPFHVWLGARTLGEPAIVQCEQLLTISTERLIERAGALPPAAMRQVDAALAMSLGLPLGGA